MVRKILTEDIFQEMYNDYKNGLSALEISEKYNFKQVTVRKHFNDRNLYFSTSKRFEKDELENIIFDYKNGMKPYELEKKYNRKAITLKLKNQCKYQDWEVQFIINNWKTMTDKEMSDKLSKSFRGLKNKRLSLGLFRTKEKSCYMGIHDYLRANNVFWKKESMENSKYRCILTNNRFDDIHHIYSFNLIVSEVIETLNIDLQKSMDDFSKEELKEILLTFREIQNSYPIGVCLSKDIHKLFHELYGYGNTTEKEWDEFVKNYKNNKYNHLINVA